MRTESTNPTGSGLPGGVAAGLTAAVVVGGSPLAVGGSPAPVAGGLAAAVTLVLGLGVSRVFDRLPDQTPVHALLATTPLVGLPAVLAVLVAPPTAGVLSGGSPAATVAVVVAGGLVTTWVFLYVFTWRHRRNPMFSTGEDVG